MTEISLDELAKRIYAIEKNIYDVENVGVRIDYAVQKVLNVEKNITTMCTTQNER